MKRSGQCPKCGSKTIIANARPQDHGEGMHSEDLKVATYKNPTALIFKGEVSSAIGAWICGDCGFMELYADRPAKLVVPTQD